MKYIIVAKNIFNGDSKNDIANPLSVTEIATELVITRLRLIDLLQSGHINSSDCVVTIGERKCLYTNIFENVMDFKEFSLLSASSEDVIDLLENNIFNQMAAGNVNTRIIPYKPFYRNWERDKDLILNVEWSSLGSYDLSEPFVVLVIRTRAAWSEKNMTDIFWENLISKLTENNKKIFVFGKETEVWEDKFNISYIKNYQDWCTISKHENCKCVFSTMTGGVYPCLIFGSPKIKMILIDNTKLMRLHAGDPSFYDDCINFSNIKIEFIEEVPTIENAYDKISKNL
jgi:hypothetical protein